MSGASIGFFGKLPSHGDFVRRRVPEAFVNTWDPWLQSCMHESRQQLEAQWLQIYLTSPIWRFVLCEGVVGAATFAGLLVPSVDRVGRYFPMTIVAELPADLAPMTVAIQGRQWFRTVQALALQALESPDFTLEEFDAALDGSASELASLEERYCVRLDESFPAASHQWRIPVESADRMAAALIDPLLAVVGRDLRPLSIWWSDGSDRLGPSCLLVRSLPESRSFTSMLDGSWQEGGWSGDHGEVPVPAAPPFNYQILSSSVTDTGPAREQNQDNFLERTEHGLWAVADGMGGHSNGEKASQMVVDALGSLEPAATVSSALETARTALQRVNDDLERSALQAGESARSGSTVVVLSVRQLDWGVLWAGDSRVYLLRDDVLTALTQDHSGDRPLHDDVDDAGSVPPPSTGVVTRAVGGAPALDLDQNSGTLQPGDRFLLCSDGLHGSVDHETMLDLLKSTADPAEATRKLLQAALEARASDNVTAVVVDVTPSEG